MQCTQALATYIDVHDGASAEQLDATAIKGGQLPCPP